MELEVDISEVVKLVKQELTRPYDPFNEDLPILISEKDKLLTIYMTEIITSPSEYNKMCHTLESLEPDWKVKMILNTPGGYASSAFSILDSMGKCKCPIHGVVTGSVASAGTIIAMGCDTIEVADFTDFMIHNYSHGANGSGSKVKEYVNFTDLEFTKAARTIYEGFLTSEELESISLDDKEIWLNKDQVLERWAKKKFRLNRLAEV